MNGGKEIRGARGWLLVTFEFNFFETNNKIGKISNNLLNHTYLELPFENEGGLYFWRVVLLEGVSRIWK